MNNSPQTFGDINLSVVEIVGPLEDSHQSKINEPVITEENVKIVSDFARNHGIRRFIKEALEGQRN